MRTYTVVVVDDHGLFREGLIGILNRHDSIRVLGEGATSDEAETLVATLAPNALILDVELDSTPAAVTVRRIRRNHPDTGIIILTMHRDAALERELIGAGASSYLTKTAPSSDLVEAIQRVTEERHERIPEAGSSSSLLSPRELDVLRRVSRGLSNKQIAESLQIAPGTVKRHLDNLFRKLGATGRVDALNKAAHIIDLNERAVDDPALPPRERR
ncbi:LuxR C-terminal-related transcriptional regulator [Luethyella okanaganae]|uniref:LuxR C-terminal-related transcriptional regulator n=1 Tax=Luethyella okanaganae TaxID=69372 RepID=A0ABW1VEV5_9MICO